jgi:hypothetical protein
MGPGIPAHAITLASLAGLPNELLYKIFTYLSTRDLLTLAAVCHRLRLIALSTYLSAHGINPESLLSSPTLVLTSEQMNALPGLLSMLTRPRAKSVRFVWCGRRSEYTIVNEVSRVARWIKMLDDLEELVLDFTDVGWGHLVDMRDYGTPRYPLVHFEGWSRALMELLSEIARSPCRRLYIHDTRYNCWPNPIPRSSPPAIRTVENSRPRMVENGRPRTAEKSKPRTFNNIKQSFYDLFRPRDVRTTPSPTPVPSPNSAPSPEPAPSPQPAPSPDLGAAPIRAEGEQDGSPGLQSLWLDCSFLFKSSDLIEWTISTLARSSATLTTLAIVDHGISTKCFTIMLRLLHLPQLSTLSISFGGLRFYDLATFLGRHPAITVLKLLRGRLCHDGFPAPSWNLPRLRTLCATPDYVDHLLRGHGRGWFPELDSISIEYESYDREGSENTEKALWAVSEFCGMWEAEARKNKWLSLSITIDTGFRGYLSLGTSHRTSRPEQQLHRVGSLHLATIAEKPLSPKIVIDWLRLFPALNHVSFTGTSLPPMDRTERAEYVRQASDACPSLQTVQIASVKATVHEWLEDLPSYPTCALYFSSLKEIHI